MARPGLYDELVKRNLLNQGRTIACGDGSDVEKSSRLDLLLKESGSDFDVSPRSVFIVRHRLASGISEQPTKKEKDVKRSRRTRSSPAGGKKNIGGIREKKPLHPHDGRKGNGGKPPPGPHSTGFKPGNDMKTVTGEFRNPFLHGVSAEQQVMVAVSDDMSPSDLLRQSIGGWRLQILDMRREIEAIKSSKHKWVWLGSTYTRQEGDGEIMGTGRISQRKRMPKEEAMKVMIEALARVQSKHDSAVRALHEMGKNDTPGNSNIDAYLEALKKTAKEVWGDDGDDEPEGVDGK